MIEIEYSKAAPTIASLLQAKGTALLGVQWLDNQVASAKKTLDASDDAHLFAPSTLRDESMATAIRALLYLWNGWIDESSMYAQGARPKESLFILGLSERHHGNASQAKAFFLQLHDHPIYPSLAKIANELIATSPDESLKRFREILRLNGTWEPYVFIDIYEQARVDETKITIGDFVRQMQGQEFSLLFGHCYKAVTGEDILKHTKVADTSWKPKRRAESLANRRDRLIREKASRLLIRQKASRKGDWPILPQAHRSADTD